MNIHVFCSDLGTCRGSLAETPYLGMITVGENNTCLSKEGFYCILTVLKCTLYLPGAFLLGGVVSHVSFKGWRYFSVWNVCFFPLEGFEIPVALF